ncbi:MAG: M20 family metallopeptidase [Thaumarchaeota archaeon]|nr:M20 family metallopeptidase [Nitrososphaerota archaeon]
MPLLKFDEQYIVSLASNLVRINSENPPGREAEIASFVAERLSDLGFKARVDRFDKRANSLGFHKFSENGSRLMLLTHLDTVPAGDREAWRFPPFEGVVHEGRLYGRGAADAKGPLASMLGGLKALIDSGIELCGELVFAAVADEELESQGVRRLLASGLKADYAIVGEPTSLQVCIAHKGRLVLSINFLGRSAHASAPDLGVNPIQIAARFIERLDDLSKKLSEKHHQLLGSPTISPTIIRGGIKDNMIPDSLELIIDRRVLPQEDLETIVGELDELSKESAKRYNADSGLRIIRWVPPAEVDRRSPIVLAAIKAIEEVLKIKGEVRGFQATCDMSYLVNNAGIQSVILGPGSLEQAHAIDEWVSVEELVSAAKIYAFTILNILKPFERA